MRNIFTNITNVVLCNNDCRHLNFIIYYLDSILLDSDFKAYPRIIILLAIVILFFSFLYLLLLFFLYFIHLNINRIVMDFT